MLFNKLKFLLKNPMGLFVYGILSKWYTIVAVAALIVTFWVLKGLTDAGILQAAEKVILDAFNDTKSVARYCTPKITSPADFWDCLQNPPHYEPTKEETILEKSITDSPKSRKFKKNKDPYSE